MLYTLEDLRRGRALLIPLGKTPEETEFGNTAAILEHILLDPSICGLPREAVQVLCRPITTDVAVGAIGDCVREKPSWLLVYVGTHGNEDGSLIMDGSSMHPAVLARALRSADPAASRLVLFIDSCYSGASLYSSGQSGPYTSAMGDLEGLGTTHVVLFTASARASEMSVMATPTEIGPLGFLPLTPFGVHLVEALLGAAGRSDFVYTDDVEAWLRDRLPETTAGAQRPLFIRNKTFPLTRGLGSQQREEWAKSSRRVLQLAAGAAHALPIRVTPAHQFLVELARRVLLSLVPTHRILRFPGSTWFPLLDQVRELVGAAIHGATLEYFSIRSRVWLRVADGPTLETDARRALERLRRGLPAHRLMARVHLYRAIARLRNGETARAAMDLRRSARLDGKLAASWFYLAITELLHLVDRRVRNRFRRDLVLAYDRKATRSLDRCYHALAETERLCRRRFRRESPWGPEYLPGDPAVCSVFGILHVLTQLLSPSPLRGLGSTLDTVYLMGALEFRDCEPRGLIERLAWTIAPSGGPPPASEAALESADGYLQGLAVLQRDDATLEDLLAAETGLLRACDDPGIRPAARSALGILAFRRSQWGWARDLFTEADRQLANLGKHHLTVVDRAGALLLRAFSNWGLGAVAGIPADLAEVRRLAPGLDQAVRELEGWLSKAPRSVSREAGQQALVAASQTA
jgi:hypothetical protein